MIKNKKNVIIISAVIVVILLSIMLLLLLGGKDSYRLVKIYEFEGLATVNRMDQGEIEPYANMLLESGDHVVLDSGNMTLKMDEDKYAYVEEQTEFSIRAEGSSENGKIRITVDKGAITNEIQNPLRGEASYEVNTPNSTMAVRGTIFRVHTYYDEEGVCYTRISVFEGEVVSRLVYPNGTISEQEVSVPAGKEVIIYEDGKTTDYLTDVMDIDYTSLSQSVISRLENIMEIGLETNSEEKGEEETQTTEEKTLYDVTFIYGGKTFATQQVARGACVSVPSLVPALSGDWDFDFSTPITEDISIYWNE